MKKQRVIKGGTHLDQGAAAPFTCGQLAAGGPRGAAALVVTLDVCDRAALDQGLLLPVPGDGPSAFGARGLTGIADVATRAAVVSVQTAHCLGGSKGRG